MADKSIFIADGPKKGQVPRSPFDLTFTNNNTGKFGTVQCTMMKYYPAGTKLKIKPSFVYDLQPLVFPIQTNVRCHVELYKVPLRILCDNWEDFVSQLGTNGTPVNSGGTPYVIPYIKREPGWNANGTLAEQLGVSNGKFAEVDEMVLLPTVRFYGNINTIHKRLIINSSSTSQFFAMFQLHDNMVLKDVSNGSYNSIINEFQWYDTSSTISSNLSGSLRYHICVRPADYLRYFNGNDVSVPADIGSDLVWMYSSPNAISTKVSSASSMNSATSGCYYAHGNVLESINGLGAYRHQLHVKQVDENLIKTFATLRAAGMKPLLVVEFIDGLKSLFTKPKMDVSNVDNQGLAIQNITEIKEDTGAVIYTSPVQMWKNSLGIDVNARVGVTIITESEHNYFDSVNGAEPEQPVCALPFRAIEFIHNYFKRKPRIDPFIKDGVPSYNQFLTNTGMGADSTTPVDTWNAMYEDDYFTTCVKEPQFGNAPLVGVTVNDTSDTGILRFSSGSNPAQNYSVEVPINEDGAVMPPSVYHGETANRPNLHTLRELIDIGISINDLRNVSTFQRMLERMQRSVQAGGSPYKNYMYEFFGTNPPIGDHYPQYLGGVTRNISVNKITNVALSETAKLGEFAGQARISGEGKYIKTFLTEPCYIVAIQYFTVTPVYSQYTPKHFFYQDPLDFYLDPDFATISPQPVFKKELAIGQLQSSELNDVFGYNRPYAELVSNVDEVHGNFRTDMANYLLQRVFGTAPNLNKQFIEIDPNDLLNIFSVVDNTDKIYGQCRFEIHGSLPMPRSYTPHTI